MSKNSRSPSGKMPRTVGLLGGGIIGGGWAARFLLSGVDVKLYDPAPGAADAVGKIVNDARRAYQQMGMPALAEGSLTLLDTVEETVRDVEFVQESAPERLDLKQKLLLQASRAAAQETLICSSTSGFMPSVLQQGVDYPERVIIAHPFNPVYLLPLVELCGPRADPRVLERAAEIFRAVGMHPLLVRKEIGGFIANRIQEAIWREGMWLVHEDVATLEDLDDAIRYSFGLRLAVKGPFHMGGGGSAMRKAIEKWGPDLTGDWTKFPTPEHDEAFIDKLAAQSDARSEKMTGAEVKQKLDGGLVAVLQGLRSVGYGAGESFSQWEQVLRTQADKLSLGGSMPVPTAGHIKS